MPRIVAFFASSAISVASCLPAAAQERAGVVEAIDEGCGTLRLADGSSYALPGDLDCSRVRPGMEVHLLFTHDPSQAVQIQS